MEERRNRVGFLCGSGPISHKASEIHCLQIKCDGMFGVGVSLDTIGVVDTGNSNAEA